MRLYKTGHPLIILSHRKQEFIGRTMWSIRNLMFDVTDVIVVDDSGDPEHHQWLDDHGFQFSAVHPTENRGYLEAMERVWSVARDMNTDYTMLWEEDFHLSKPVLLNDMATVLEQNPSLAQLNLQRQAVYRVERRLGYMESHQRRGYRLSKHHTGETKWVKRRMPFTTNPSLIRRAVLDVNWPDRDRCDRVPGGAEPAMSLELERAGYEFGWFGGWNTPHVHHVGDDMKTGKGY